ncbi:hypothetical protein M3559_00430 [Staphylococcus equorum]|uniref:hypothetical protein n=1 Tax=Staphylococcus equorum TaxID=246432 RepID=UPI0018D88883|nr:hypothetical protein [Staphylococcus equorum]MCM3071117.1 hypothetical protein [Staphylococcus equorum]QPS99706.1 hypothetical protein I6G41_01080 [Staphylococcus equorum]QPS99863.1 hypothetical protein I6G41_02030 [Staphylococcus equorum]
MEITCSICFTDGSYIVVDKFDEILFLNQIPYVEASFKGYSLQKDEFTYYKALNNLSKYSFIGINRNDNKDEIEFGGKKFVYNDYHKSIDKNEILYIQTSAVSTIAVY